MTQNRSTALAARLRQLRGSRLQSSVAQQLGISAPLLSSWERGSAVPPALRLADVAKALAGPDDDATMLLRELLELRGHEHRQPIPQAPVAPPTDIELLQEIRWLLLQIRDRLPPLN